MNVEQPSARSVKAVKNAMNAVAVTSLDELLLLAGTNKYLDLNQETTLNEQIITRTKCEDR